MKKISIIISTIFVLLFLNACTKENIINLPTETYVKIPSYLNDSVVNETALYLLKVNKDSRDQWEVQQGFKSFGSICDDLYLTINPEQFKNIEELKYFVAKHNQYLQLILDENGEYTLETIGYKNLYRYMVNENQEMMVGNQVCKMLESDIVNPNTNELFASSGLNTFQLFSSKLIDKNNDRDQIIDGCAVAERFYDTKDNSRDRTVFELIVSTGSNYLLFSYRIQPYKKTMGIWYQCNRTLYWDYTFIGTLYQDRRAFPFSYHDHYTTMSPQRSLVSWHYHYMTTTTSTNYSFTCSQHSYKAWTPSVSEINFYCNKNLYEIL